MRDRERDLWQVETRHLLDEVRLACDVPGAPGRNRDRAPGELEPEPLERPLLLRRIELEPDEIARALRAELDDRPLGQRPFDVRVAGPARSRELDQQLGGERGRLRGEVGIDALLPTVRALGAQRVSLRALADSERLEVRRLQQDGRRLRPHLGLEAAHDPGKRHRALSICDDEVGRVQLAELSVEARELLSRACAPHDDAAARQRVEVEDVERVPERMHDVVRHVDDVRDRAHARGHEARPQPGWRRFHAHVAEEAADVARAAFEVLDRHVDRLVADPLGLGARQRPELEVVERGHLAGDSVDR